MVGHLRTIHDFTRSAYYYRKSLNENWKDITLNTLKYF